MPGCSGVYLANLPIPHTELPGLDLMFSDHLAQWLIYFQDNASVDEPFSWFQPETLTPSEYRRIHRSIATFQLGESSEGRHLMQAAIAFAETQETPDLVAITKLFIKEEQRHAALLKRFMDKHHIPTLRKQWTDSIFRKLRKNTTFETSVTVLICAEIIALTYYHYLAHSTQSTLLADICKHIIKEETAHVEYGASVLNHLRHQYSPMKQWLLFLRHNALFAVFLGGIYWQHYGVIHQTRFSFSQFWCRCWHDYHNYFSKPSSVSQVRSAVL